MIEKEIEVFIECLESYFSKKTKEAIVIETPYLTSSVSQVLKDFTGIISISGAYQGYVYFTAPETFLKRLIDAHGQSDFSEAIMSDAVGEVTNTLSGNSRKSLGSNFVISVPNVVKGDKSAVELAKGVHSYVVPMKWSNCSAAMIVSVKKL